MASIDLSELWLKIFLLVLSFIAGAFEIWFGRKAWTERKRSKKPIPINWWKTLGVPGVVMLSSVISVCVLVKESAGRASEKAELINLRKKDEGWQKDTSRDLDLIAGKMGVEERNSRYIQQIREVNGRYLSENVRSAAKALFDNASERKKQRDEVEKVNAEALSVYRPWFEPVYDVITQRFDFWTDELEKRGLKPKAEKNDTASVGISLGSYWRTIRTVTFPNEVTVTIQMIPARIENGIIEGGLRLIINTSIPKRGGDNLITIDIGNDMFSVRNQRPSKLLFKDASSTTKNPIADPILAKALDESINQLMAYIADEAAATP
jgi:hypothetical protein